MGQRLLGQGTGHEALADQYLPEHTHVSASRSQAEPTQWRSLIPTSGADVLAAVLLLPRTVWEGPNTGEHALDLLKGTRELREAPGIYLEY